MGRMSVGEYLARPREAGVRYADVAGMGEAEVEALLFRRPMPDWAEVAAELRKPAVTLRLVWREYRDRHAHVTVDEFLGNNGALDRLSSAIRSRFGQIRAARE
ncbi:MAG: hypothetical protein WAN43_15420 [Rhodomicrobium sp.]